MKFSRLFYPLFCLLCLPTMRADGGIEALITLRHGEDALGTVRIHLDHERAPRTVANFIGLATGAFNWIDPNTDRLMVNTPYYDGLIFHRLDPDFMIQGGDPTGTGRAGPGYVFQDEFHPDLRNDPYTISMAHSGPSSNGSQFFLNFFENGQWNNYHSVFGYVVDDGTSRELLDSLRDSSVFETNEERPTTDIVMVSVVIEGLEEVDFDLFDPALQLPRLRPAKPWLSRNEEGVPTLNWEAKDLAVYQLLLTQNLQNWPLSNNFIYHVAPAGVYEQPLFEIEPGTSIFFSLNEIDYTDVPPAPLNIFENGSTLIMDMQDGKLTVVFGSGEEQDYGNWVFEGVSGTKSGSLLEYSPGKFVPSIWDRPLQPIEGVTIKRREYRDEIHSLNVRALYLELSEPIGAKNFAEIEVSLSFHTHTTGWLNGFRFKFEKEDTKSENTRGPFTWIPPED